MSRSINEVKCVVFSIDRIIHLNGMAFDSNAAFALQVHIVKDLVLHFLGANGLCELEQSVGQGTLAVIDVSNYTEVSYIFHLFIKIKMLLE